MYSFVVKSWVSGICFQVKWALLQLYHTQNKLHLYDEMMVIMSALYTLTWIIIVLTQWNNNSRVGMATHIILFPTNKSLLLLLMLRA
jgi:hypothetical protein